LDWRIYCDDHSSLSSTTAVQIWIMSYMLHIFWYHVGSRNNCQVYLVTVYCATLILWTNLVMTWEIHYYTYANKV